MRKHGWKKNHFQLSRTGVSWVHPMHKKQMVTIGKYSPNIIATGRPLTLCIPATMTPERVDALYKDGLHLYYLDKEYQFRDALQRILDWFDRIVGLGDVNPSVDA